MLNKRVDGIIEELSATHLSKRFLVNRKEIPAFEDINLAISKGRFVTIVGPSGCGKSTLLRCLAGFESPSSGMVQMKGIPVNKPSKDRMVVFQSFEQLFPWMTVLKNIVYAIRVTESNAKNEELRNDVWVSHEIQH